MPILSSIKIANGNKEVVVAENGKLPQLDGSLLKNINVGDYTAFKVYVHSDTIQSGVYNDTCQNVIKSEIPPCKTHQFVIRSRSDQGFQDVIVDWGDNTITEIKNQEDENVYFWNEGDRRYRVTHTYQNDGVYTVKVKGTTFFGIYHEKDNNLLLEAMTSYLPIARCHTNMSQFCQWSMHLTWVSAGLHMFQGKDNFSHMFESCYNLLNAYGLSSLPNNSAVNGIFAYCYNLTETDFKLPSNAQDTAYYAGAFKDCTSLGVSLDTLLPKTGFCSRIIDFSEVFMNMPLLKWSDASGNILWGNPNIEWRNTGNTFAQCSDELRGHIPVSWGGTLDDSNIVGNIPTRSISLNGNLPNSANGLAIIDDNGKLPTEIIPTYNVDLSNYNGEFNITNNNNNSSIRTSGFSLSASNGCTITANNGFSVTSTGDPLKLLTAGQDIYIQAANSTFKATAYYIKLEALAKSLTYNGAELNTPGGLVCLDSSGKISASLIPEQSSNSISVGNGLIGDGTESNPLKLDLSNYSVDTGIHIYSSGANEISIYKGLSGLSLNGTEVFLESTDVKVSLVGPSINLNDNPPNTTGGFAVVQENGKLPSSILPEQLLVVNAHNVPFETTSETGDVVVLTKEQLNVSSECEFDIIDSDGYNVSCDSRISRRWTDSGYEITFSGGWPTSSWTLKPHGQNGKDGVSIDRNPIMEFTFLDEKYGRCVYLDDTTPNMVLTDNVYYAKKVRMRIESSNDSFSGNVVIIPVVNGVELEPYVCGTGNWSEISFSSLEGGVATGSLSFRRDTNNELDTLKDGTVITAVVTVLEVVYER